MTLLRGETERPGEREPPDLSSQRTPLEYPSFHVGVGRGGVVQVDRAGMRDKMGRKVGVTSRTSWIVNIHDTDAWML